MTQNTKDAGESLLPCQSARSKGHIKHGHTSRELLGKKDSPTYRSWSAMHARCRLTGRDNADRYKARGVAVCERWSSFENFLADMGERPEGKTLDRFPDAGGNYEPGNCRWATAWEQSRNTRRNKLTLESATEAAFLRLTGATYKDIALKFGVSESLPREIVKGRTWPDALAAAKQKLERNNG